MPSGALPSAPAAPLPSRTEALNGALRVGRYRPIWASPEVEISPSLQFLVPEQHVELSPGDAARLGVKPDETVEVATNGTAIRATVAIRTGVRPGTAFVADGLAENSANVLTGATVEIRRPAGERPAPPPEAAG
jgi:NADH-quinone oxidoreductase subunit G